MRGALKSCLAGVLTLLALAAPRVAQAEEPLADADEPPARAKPATEPDLPPPSTRLNLALTGVGVTAGFYGAALGSSLIWHTGPWADEVRIPIVGPWMAMPYFKCGSEPNCGTALVIVRGVLAGIDAIGQAGGVLIALESLFVPTASAKRAAVRRPAHARVRPVPFVAGRDGFGLGIAGEL
ncbi:MAG TPA: hypothetical protein VFV94_15955 [Polyangiaceae bacterium]|nr:hypothetical protein [Polyangiaceae bacterium]